MNKIEIEVPKEVRYISEWTDFPKERLSTGHCIVNKTITGCGYTHYTLTNDQNVILCSPRKFLLENKYVQLYKNYNIYLVINSGEKSLDIDGAAEKSSHKSLIKSETDSENLSIINDLKTGIYSYLVNSAISNHPAKILVTYDSLKYVLEAIGKDISNYSIIVDEFQNIFMDSSFKAETELNFVSVLQDCPNVTYLSATPYIEEYLEELDEFKNLPYYEFKWDESRLRTISIDYKRTSSISREIDKIIYSYKSGNYPVKIDENKIIHESKEVIFYVNSVRTICSTVKRNNLQPDEVNIICANTSGNQTSLKKVGLTVGKAPLKGESHKMFTFCTRTTYAGADFYSPNAYSVIVSDCKIDSLATDIRMDFPQIMGRQRLKENVFRDECTFIFTLSDSELTEDMFFGLRDKKLVETSKDIKNFNSILKDVENDSGGLKKLLQDIRDRIHYKKYSLDYTGINKDGIPVVNKLVMLSEKRAFELRSGIYRDVFSVYNEFSSISNNISLEKGYNVLELIKDYQQDYLKLGRFVDKMKLVCSLLLNPDIVGRISISDLYWVDRDLKNYLYYLGPKKIRALGYEEIKLKEEISNLSSSDQIKEKFISTFLIGEKYTLKYIKKCLKQIYIELNIAKTPKAVDLGEYFNVKLVKIYDPSTKKQSSGYEILSLK